MEPSLRAGDIIIFYRTADGGPDYYTSVITVLAVVENVVDNFTNFEEFKTVCRKRSVFTDENLLTHLNYKSSKPFIINFLYAYYLPVRPNLKALKENNVIENDPGCFEEISDEAFKTILRISVQIKVLLSIKPQYADKILSGDKKFEFRRLLYKSPCVKNHYLRDIPCYES